MLAQPFPLAFGANQKPSAGAVDAFESRGVDFGFGFVAELDGAKLHVQFGRVFGRPLAFCDKAKRARFALHMEAAARVGSRGVVYGAHPAKTLAGGGG